MINTIKQSFKIGVSCIFILGHFLPIVGQDLDEDNDGIPDIYEKGLGNLNFGNAFNITGPSNNVIEVNQNEVRLTSDERSLRGSAMSFGLIDFQDDFSFTVEAFFGVNRDHGSFSTSGADGIAIVFHNDPNGSNAIGIDGEGIGAQGIQNGVVLEIDTYGNGDTGTNDPLRGEGDNHTDIWDSDDPDRESLMGSYKIFKPGENSPLEDGSYHAVIFTWVANTGTLSFTLDGERVGELSAGSVEAFANLYFDGATAVHFGFTASTGGARNEHRVRIVSMEDLPVVLDTDNDGIFDHVDLDSDNDGIYDADEAGHGAVHNNGVVDSPDLNGDGIPDAVQGTTGFGDIAYTLGDLDGDGIYNHQDIDADGDGCFDATEMGFKDQDEDGRLGVGEPVVDENGVVVGESGYTGFNSSFLNPDQNSCLLTTDLGDEGDGDDAYVTYFEDDPAVDMMVTPRILNLDSGRAFLDISLPDVPDLDRELLSIKDLTIPIGNSSWVGQLIFNDIPLTFSSTGAMLSIRSQLDTLGLIPIETLEEVLDHIAYAHEDTIMPTPGERVLEFVVNDGNNSSPMNTVTVLVLPVNDPPVADNDTITIDNINAVPIQITDGDMDFDGTLDLSGIEIVSNPQYGKLTVSSQGFVSYAPDTAIQAIDQFRYTILDNESGVSNEAAVIVNLDIAPESENNTPVAVDDQAQTRMDVILEVNSAEGLLVNDTDEDNDDLRVISFEILGIRYSVGQWVEFSGNSLSINEDGSYSFFPAEGFTGQIPTVEYTISDGELTANAELRIQVTDINQSPVAEDVTVTVKTLEQVFISLFDLTSDPDQDNLTFTITSNKPVDVPGVLSGPLDGEISFTPTPGFVGTVTIEYQVCDDGDPQLCDTGVIVIEVLEMDSDEDGILDTMEDQNLDQNLLNDDCDSDGIPNFLDADPCSIDITVSSVITNNGDQLNDYLRISGIEQFESNHVIIFNRWGNKVWEIKGYDNSISSKKFSGQGASELRLPDGTYYYVINLGNSTTGIKGFFTLLNQ